MAEPIQLRTFDKIVNEQAVEILEELLAEAWGGDISSIMFVSFRPDGKWREDGTGISDVITKAGALSRMLYRHMQHIDAGNIT